MKIAGAASKRRHIRESSLERSRSHKDQNGNNDSANQVGNNSKSLVSEGRPQNQLKEHSRQRPHDKRSNTGRPRIVNLREGPVPPGTRKNGDGDDRGREKLRQRRMRG